VAGVSAQEKKAAYLREWRANNRERVNELSRRWYRRNVERAAEAKRAKRNADLEGARAKEAAKREKNREAIRAAQKAWREKNKETLRERNRVKWAENKEEYSAQARARLVEDPRFSLLAKAKERAKKRGLRFDLSKEDVVVPAVCPVLGIKLEHKKGGGPQDASPTIDRIDNALGYVKGNVIVVSCRANRIKNDATPSELRAIVGFYERLS
jgi:hypothetical protein